MSMALVAVAGSLYKQYSITFWAAVLGVLFGVIGMIIVPDASAEELEMAKMLGVEVSQTKDTIPCSDTKINITGLS